MMGKLNAGTKEALFVLGALTVAFVVGIAVLAVWLSGEDGAEPAPPAPPPAEPPPPEPPAAPAGDPVAGKEVFALGGCGSCHTLADAGGTGTIGPNLDDSKPPLELVIDRVTNGKSAMPAFGESFTEQQIQDVAAYVVKATSG